MPWYAQGDSQAPASGKFRIRFFDVDGTVLLQRYVDEGWSVAPPTSPVRVGLTFVGWSGAAILVTSSMDIIANYSVDDGKAHILVEASSLAGLTPTLKLNKSDTSTLLVEWGDGTTSTTSASGNVTIVKDAAYAPGSYDIKKSITVGTGTFTGGHGTTGTPMIAGVAVTEVWYRQATTSISDYSLNGTAFRTMRVVLGGNNITSIGAYAFLNCCALVTASFPSATSIGTGAFQYCYALVTVSFPSATSIEAYAFLNCYALVTASFPSATSIGTYALQNCLALVTASFPSATSIGTNAFQNCYALVTASFPSATSIGAYALQNCYALVTASFPSATSIGTNALQNCYALVTVSFPSATSIGTNAFQNCRILGKYLIGPNCTLIDLLAFDGCKLLRKLTMQAATPPTLAATTVFGDYDPRFMIEVPAASLAAYQAATNWSAYASRMVGI